MAAGTERRTLEIVLAARNLSASAFNQVTTSLARIHRSGREAFANLGRVATSARAQVLGVVAALGGILLAPTVTLDSASLSLIIVNAYAAAIFGRLRSLPLTFLGAIVVGLTEGYLFGYLPQDNQYLASFRPAASVLILFLVLLVVERKFKINNHNKIR